MSVRKKIVMLPYDFDTAIGTNNEGALQFSYNLEDIDVIGNNTDVYNGQNSVLWKNVRAAFFDDLKSMYQTLRSQGKLSYSKIEQMFEEHQGKWPEAVFNEDSYFTYLQPLVDPGSEDPTAAYLSMLQGSKEQQRKWWLYNRFRYIDSKYNAGDALTDVITLRGYAKANITVTPYADIYATVKYGSYLVQQRAARNTAYTLVCPLDNVNDTEIYIYSASQLASVGDLSGLMVGYANFANATRLQSLKLGDSSNSYENDNMLDLYLGNNVLLETLDVRNCSNLGGSRSVGGNIVNSTTPTIDLSGCVGLKYAYFDGTSVKGVSIANGAPLLTLHLPGTITNLTLKNLQDLTDLTVTSLSNVTTLWLENCSSEVDPLEILDEMTANSRVRIIGFNVTATTSEIEDLLDILDTMRGLDENGNTIEIEDGGAQVSGIINTGTISGALMRRITESYPGITVNYESLTCTVRYYSEDGQTLIRTQTVSGGQNITYGGTTPTKTSTAQYSYTFAGWSRVPNGTADPTAQQAVNGDRDLYAAFTATVRSYSITWVSNGTTLRTDTLAYGAMPSWGQAMPTKDGQTATGWSPEVHSVTGAQTYTAVYLPVYSVRFYNGSTLLQTSSVVQGSNATYTGSTPVSSEDASLAFLGWTRTSGGTTADANALNNIQANTDVYAVFESAVEVAEITDSWDTIITKIANGTANYKVGNYKPLDLGTEGIINMQIVGKNTSPLAAGGGTAMYDWLGMELLATSHRMNPDRSGSSGNYTEGTGAIGGWEKCEMRSYLKETIKPLIPATVRNAIKEVTKYSRIYNSAGTAVNDVATTEDVWIPSRREMFGAISNAETQGPIYDSIFPDNASRVKSKAASSGAAWWWLRSASTNSAFNRVSTDGSTSSNVAYSSGAVPLGFSI